MTGLTTHAFAQEIGVSQKTISDAETDKRAVRPITLKAYAMRSGVSVFWLQTGKAPVNDGGPTGGEKLPRLDSNQESTGFRLTLVRAA